MSDPVDYSGHVPAEPTPLDAALSTQMEIVKLAYQLGFSAGYAQAIIDAEKCRQ